MHNSWLQLNQIAPPPKLPQETGGDWQQVEATLELKLPNDYKQLISQYGTGRFSDFLYIFNPFAANEYFNLIYSSQKILTAQKELRKEFTEKFPFPLFPEPEGLFPWGATDNGNILYWYTKGEPHTWPILIWESRGSDYEIYNAFITEFLAQWLSREIDCQLFPETDEYFPDPVFEEYRELEHVSVFFEYTELAYEQRVKLIWNYLGQGKVKGMYIHESRSQTHFLVNELEAESTYWDNTSSGSILRLAYPQAQADRVRDKIFALSKDLNLPIKQILDYSGNRIWS